MLHFISCLLSGLSKLTLNHKYLIANKINSKFNIYRQKNDMAILELREEDAIDLNIYTPACLAALDADYTGQNGRVYGM